MAIRVKHGNPPMIVSQITVCLCYRPDVIKRSNDLTVYFEFVTAVGPCRLTKQYSAVVSNDLLTDLTNKEALYGIL